MITVSIVTHNTPAAQLLEAVECCLRSVRVKKVMIVDNSDTDVLREVVCTLPRTEYVKVENEGFGSGHNVAIKKAMQAGAKYHVVMNADVRWEGDVLATIADLMDSRPEVGLLGPKVYYPDGVLQYSCRMLPTPIDLIAKRFLPKCLIGKRLRRYLLADVDHDREFDCPYLLGCFMFFRCKVFATTGMFDERFFMYPEDIDITRRTRTQWHTIYWPGVSIIHDHAAASRKNLKMLRIHVQNMIKYFNKWGWWSDTERIRLNRELLHNAPRCQGAPPLGRG